MSWQRWNLKRRHLNESQRAMVAARIANMKQGARTDLSPIYEMSQQQAANLLNVGRRGVERATVVRDRGAPELQAKVDAGRVSVSAAADVATLSEPEQQEVVATDPKLTSTLPAAARLPHCELADVLSLGKFAEVPTRAEADMMEIRFRAERRLGELMKAQRDAGLMSSGGAVEGVGKRGFENNPRSVEALPTLSEAGIDKNLADRAQKYAAVPEAEFKAHVDTYRQRVVEEGERARADLLSMLNSVNRFHL